MKILKAEVKVLKINADETTNKLIEMQAVEIKELRQQIFNLSSNMSEMLMRIVNIETKDSIYQSPAKTKVDHFKCSMCDQTFHSENMLRKHMNMKHTIEKSLNKVEAVNIVHQDSDSGVSDSECSTCSDKFKTNKELDFHIKEHFEENENIDIEYL